MLQKRQTYTRHLKYKKKKQRKKQQKQPNETIIKMPVYGYGFWVQL